ncbi:MaoC/PaaZ C-terminal domain-containing protein [Ottowia sp.]|uniref:MaoC/PaaZ C-terminal domain-containing protein n=1 Tax=Ottowia sp. TaxID=1898956 RepID=UPI0025D651A3|nr:MaoC/PaaZ C-terminal domain-containing protein [Ottowia sp.]MBK6746995.1 MaoC family dehydratase N-terminal domain-containing protein [Ottowia sp.]
MIDPERLMRHPIPEVRQKYTRKDTMLYALGLGLGRRSSASYEQELRYVYEKDLAALPTMSLVLGYPGLWMGDPATGIDVKRMLHGAQVVRVAKPLPAEGEVVGTSAVMSIVDKGPGRDAVVVTRRRVIDVAKDELLCELDNVSVLRGQGGFGGEAAGAPVFVGIPERTPDLVDHWELDERAAFIYRLSGDYNPLHVDDALATSVGFPRPILHGLCTLGSSVCSVSRAALGFETQRIGAVAARFTAPTYPGQRLRTEIWREEGELRFRCFTEGEGAACVLDNGSISLTS